MALLDAVEVAISGIEDKGPVAYCRYVLAGEDQINKERKRHIEELREEGKMEAKVLCELSGSDWTIWGRHALRYGNATCPKKCSQARTTGSRILGRIDLGSACERDPQCPQQRDQSIL